MPACYLDTSALAKRYLIEVGTTWMQQITNTATGNDLFTSGVTGPELISAVVRRARAGHLSPVAAAQALKDIRSEWEVLCFVSAISRSIVARAMDLGEQYGLRGFDALHVATAIDLHIFRGAQGFPPLIFISADQEQLRAALAEGMLVDDPNQHP
jgi:predicted nucleic acid-binding protein